MPFSSLQHLGCPLLSHSLAFNRPSEAAAAAAVSLLDLFRARNDTGRRRRQRATGRSLFVLPFSQAYSSSSSLYLDLEGTHRVDQERR